MREEKERQMKKVWNRVMVSILPCFGAFIIGLSMDIWGAETPVRSSYIPTSGWNVAVVQQQLGIPMALQAQMQAEIVHLAQIAGHGQAPQDIQAAVARHQQFVLNQQAYGGEVQVYYTYDKSITTQAQVVLNALGYSCGTPDGILGNSTRQALIQYQIAHGFVPDGTINPQTKQGLGIF